MKQIIKLLILLIIFALAPVSCSQNPAGKSEIKLAIKKQYLNIPLMMERETPQRKMHLRIDGEILGVFNVPFADNEADFYGFIDLSQYQGKTLTIEVDTSIQSLAEISIDDEIKGTEDLYNEQYRPQFHFSPKRGWLNDPNGLIYHNGEFHMYYQYNPFGVHWGNMSWGHAISDDLLYWEELPAVLYPEPESGMCFSGAAFIDDRNQLELKTGSEDVIVAFYLRTSIGLCYAYSNDGGYTMTDYAGNPVLDHPAEEEKLPDARMDTPRPLWHEPTQRWIAPTFDYFTNSEGEMLRCVGIYSSENLVDWTFESRVEQDRWGDEICGCVDFFELPIDGDPTNKKWVMVFIEGSYIVGDFDGHTFYTLEGKPATAQDRIRPQIVKGNFSATMTWHDMPDDRRVLISWMPTWGNHHGMPFSQQMSLPSELSLHSTQEGIRLYMNPIEELRELRTESQVMTNISLSEAENPLSALKGDVYEIKVGIKPGKGSKTELDLRGIKIIYDAETQELSCNELKSRLVPEDGQINLQFFIDRASLEIYANQGSLYIPMIHPFPPDNVNYSLSVSGGESIVETLEIHELSSIWTANSSK
ncbi:glycoside hydrolase family 32 protein [Bacteroidota bacterium]